MLDVRVVPAEQRHIEEMLPNVRQADINEFLAISGQTPREVMEHGIRISTFCCAGMVNGKVVTLFGVAPASILSGRGIPWLVATDDLQKYQRPFLRRCRHVVNAMLMPYPYLENYVDERNHVAKAWLKWLGFHLEDPAPYGKERRPFHRFYMEKK
ncbi:hypothetical protein ACYAO4_004021 [Cronobacter turicensis]